jgi:hypothetical protein
LILALIPLAAAAFSLFEWGGITTAPWHTISKYAQENPWLALIILLLPWPVAIGFDIWWLHHMRSVIPRL